MPIYMDLHIIPGVKAKDVANAHLMDVMIQKEHSCTCMTYWIDEARGHVFCLIDAPYIEMVTELHNKAHGLVPHKIIEVQTSLVESFLGRVSDPEDAEMTDEGLKLLNDPSYRFLLVIKMQDPVLLHCNLGKEKANEIVNCFYKQVRHQVKTLSGSEAEHDGQVFIASFTSAGNAVNCATSIQQQLSAIDEFPGYCMAISAGEPVAKDEKLFGETIQLGERMCFIARDRQVCITSAVKQLVFKEHYKNSKCLFAITPSDEAFLGSLFQAFDENGQEPDFNMENYCRKMAMSRSQLYRKTVALSGHSPNALLKEFRLDQGLRLLKKKRYNISEVSFSAGFSSPSYFTKCFKKKFGILPMAYLDMLD